MANVKISGLPAASAVADANEFEINETGTSKKVTGSQIASYVSTEIGALTSSDIGTTVQPYDIDTATYDATTANFTGTLQNGGSNVVVDSDIGSTVQAYDADTTKNDVANTFTANQTINADLTVDTDTLYVDSANNKVGMGTSAPDRTLHVKSDNTLAALIESTDTNFTRLQFKNANTTEPPYIGTFNNELRLNTTSASMVFQDGATEYMRINTSGNVGINNINPSYKLDVSGITRATSFLETVVAVTGTTPAISANSGNIQTWTLSGNSTPTDSLAAGQSITLMIDDGSAYTITWTSLVDQWIGGSAPTLATTGYTVVELWKVDGVTYGAYVGDAS